MQRWVRTIIALLVAMVVTLATTLVFTLARTAAGSPPGPAAATVQVVLDPRAERPAIPTLDAAQRQRITAIALGDERVTGLLGEQKPLVSQIAMWTKPGGELLGGVATLTLAEPTTLAGEWLVMAYDCGPEALKPGAIPYARVPNRATYRGVRALTIFVDLQRGQTVGIMPDHAAQLDGVPLFAPDVAVPKDTCRD